MIYAVRGLGFFALMVVGTHWELYAAATIGGLVWAGSIALSSAILADVYGVRLVGVLYGRAYLGHQLGATLSSWLGGWGYETFGSHWLAFGSAGVLLLLAARRLAATASAGFFADAGWSAGVPLRHRRAKARPSRRTHSAGSLTGGDRLS